MKKLLIAAAVVAVVPAASDFAAETAPAAAPAPAAALSTSATDIGTLMDNPASKAVLEKYIPTMIANPQFEMARAMTLKQIQGFAADQITDELLAKIDADLAALPAK